jgi:hypothetical protein
MLYFVASALEDGTGTPPTQQPRRIFLNALGVGGGQRKETRGALKIGKALPSLTSNSSNPYR